MNTECGLGQLDVSPPQIFRTPVRYVAAQHIAAFAQSRPVPPGLHLSTTADERNRKHLLPRVRRIVRLLASSAAVGVRPGWQSSPATVSAFGTCSGSFPALPQRGSRTAGAWPVPWPAARRYDRG